MSEELLPGECYFCGRTWTGRVVACKAPESHPELAHWARRTMRIMFALPSIRAWAAEVRKIKRPFGPNGFNAKWNEGAERLSKEHGLSVDEWHDAMELVNKEAK